MAADSGTASRRDSLPVISWAELARQDGDYTNCVVVDGYVIDLGEFIDRHPGGAAVLKAHLGDDATEVFQHVPAHTRAGVRSLMRQLTVGRAERSAEPGGEAGEWAGLLAHVRMLRNAFEAQFDVPRAPLVAAVYLGQSVHHLLGYHLHIIRCTLWTLSGREGDGPADDSAAEAAATLVKQLMDELVAESDSVRASEVTAAMTHAVRQLFTELVAVVAAGTRSPADARAAHALDHIDAWLSRLRHRLLGLWPTARASA